jgi:hypothetical protein
MIYWLTLSWWKYIFQPIEWEDEPWWFRFKVYLCRWRGHPAGVFFNSNTLEPDMTCNGCFDDLG